MIDIKYYPFALELSVTKKKKREKKGGGPKPDSNPRPYFGEATFLTISYNVMWLEMTKC